MAASNPWFRVYVDFLTDLKMVGLAFEDQRHFLAICALKCSGEIDQPAPPAVMDRLVAQRIWVDQASIKEVKRRLKNAGLIDDSWQPLGWDKRQFKSDTDPTGASRQKAFREKQKSGKPATSNATSNALRNGAGAVTITLPDTDTEQNRTEQIQSGAVTVAERLCVVLEKKGIEKASPDDPGLLELLAEGIAPSVFESAAAIATASSRPHMPYLLGIVRNQRTQAQGAAEAGKPTMAVHWFDSSSGIESKGAALGLQPGDAEPFPSFKARVFRAAEPRAQGISPRPTESWSEWQARVTEAEEIAA